MSGFLYRNGLQKNSTTKKNLDFMFDIIQCALHFDLNKFNIANVVNIVLTQHNVN